MVIINFIIKSNIKKKFGVGEIWTQVFCLMIIDFDLTNWANSNLL